MISNPLKDAIDQMVDQMVGQRIEATLGGFGASIDSIAAAINSRPDDPAMKAVKTLMNELSQGLSDIVSALESPAERGDPEAIAKAITAGLKALRVNVAAPHVTLNVVPAPVNNVIDLKPVFHLMERDPVAPPANIVHDIDITYGVGGLPQTMTITRRTERK